MLASRPTRLVRVLQWQLLWVMCQTARVLRCLMFACKLPCRPATCRRLRHSWTQSPTQRAITD
jgi:hypothetical protein